MLKRLMRKILGFFDIKVFEDNLVNFIAGGAALPTPYTPDEEQAVLEELRNGNEEAREKLIEHNLRLVVYIAKRFESTGVDIEDLISIGSIGLIKAINSYKADKNIKLATYASRCIENEILMYLRKTSKIKVEVSFDEPLNTDAEGNILSISDVLGTDPDCVYKDLENEDEKDMLTETFAKLNSREKLIMEMRYGLMGKEEKTQKEVADMMGISQSYISRLEKKILMRMKKEMNKLV